MRPEFRRRGRSTAVSAKGFTVELRIPSRILYTEDGASLQVFWELLVDPLRIGIHRRSLDLEAMPEDRAAEIEANIVRALYFLGYEVEFCDPEFRTNLIEVKWRFEEARRQGDQGSEASKGPYVVIDELRRLYKSLDRERRTAADAVLVEWIESEDQTTRFDALALVGEFQIVSATHALRRLRKSLRFKLEPGVSCERREVDRRLTALKKSGAEQG